MSDPPPPDTSGLGQLRHRGLGLGQCLAVLREVCVISGKHPLANSHGLIEFGQGRGKVLVLEPGRARAPQHAEAERFPSNLKEPPKCAQLLDRVLQFSALSSREGCVRKHQKALW